MKMIYRVSAVILAVALSLFFSVAYAKNPYPETLDDGNLVLVSGHMGSGYYADMSSVEVYQYAPPHYQIAIKVFLITFSDENFRQNHSFIDAPYTIEGPATVLFRYNWDDKTIAWHSHRDDTWIEWDINRDNSYADGWPLIPCTAEAAFVAAYNMRFFDDTEGYSPALKKTRRVIEESFYERLGI